jgi:hypothetical protein
VVLTVSVTIETSTTIMLLLLLFVLSVSVVLPDSSGDRSFLLDLISLGYKLPFVSSTTGNSKDCVQ